MSVCPPLSAWVFELHLPDMILVQSESRAKISYQLMHLSPPPQWLRLPSVLRRWFCCWWLAVDCYSHCSMFCCALLYVHSSFAIILMGKRELVALLSLSSWCLVIVVWLFLAVPWVCLQFVIVVFPVRFPKWYACGLYLFACWWLFLSSAD